MSKFCTQTCMPCPEPRPGRGRGDSVCEQNGICQRVSLDALPRVNFTFLGGNEIRIEVEQNEKKP